MWTKAQCLWIELRSEFATGFGFAVCISKLFYRNLLLVYLHSVSMVSHTLEIDRKSNRSDLKELKDPVEQFQSKKHHVKYLTTEFDSVAD
jgi:hypothetical protein